MCIKFATDNNDHHHHHDDNDVRAKLMIITWIASKERDRERSAFFSTVECCCAIYVMSFIKFHPMLKNAKK